MSDTDINGCGDDCLCGAPDARFHYIGQSTDEDYCGRIVEFTVSAWMCRNCFNNEVRTDKVLADS